MVSAVDALGKAMAGLDHAGFLALEATEVALIIFGWVPRVGCLAFERLVESRTPPNIYL